ncbi:hypothetical protein PN462_02225 [Spirulina sp. CS-785/01]|uniref:hypothetical protein n=1 Tax=Spirulina sp. CS-785/01 TaxID=3021716 RepID=UPI00232B0D48|nr:hypothetical protein [Spirulina sp. CS-785/01]MDB9311903.1 hypothetical protein [Spirulina sp. CS-785/01]
MSSLAPATHLTVLSSVVSKDEEVLNAIARAISLSAEAEEFSLLLVCCDDVGLRRQYIERLYAATTVTLQEVALHPRITSLLSPIESCLNADLPNGLMITGLETLVQLREFLENANIERNALQNTAKLPLLLWVNREVLAKLQRYAPDLKNWGGSAYYFPAR